MKRVLIIGYPTSCRRGASFRLPGLIRYLPDFGWQPKYPDLETIVDSAWQWMTKYPRGYE